MFLFVTLSAYFLGALTVILDKFLLGSKRISSPPVYSFYVALLGLFILVFIPFGFYWPSPSQVLFSFTGGAFFTYGILMLYFAIQRSEASRVTPIVGAVIPIIGYLLSFLFLKENLESIQINGIILLIFGGLLISFDLPLKPGKRKFFSGFYSSVFSGILLALAYLFFKLVYNEQSFINGFIWTRIGAFLAVFSFFIVPQWRKDILSSLENFSRPKKIQYQTGVIFVGNKIMGGISSMLLNYAISIGSVTLVNSLVSAQYVFVLALAYFTSLKFPSIFKENLYFWDWTQKAAAVALIGMGVFMIY